VRVATVRRDCETLVAGKLKCADLVDLAPSVLWMCGSFRVF